MKNITAFEDVRSFIVDSLIPLIPQQATRIAVDTILAIGIVQGFRLLKKEIAKI